MANEKRLIDANAIEAEIEKRFRRLIANQKNPDLAAALSYVGDLIIDAPTVDAEPVVRGHWVKYNFLGHEQYACSECQTLGSPLWKRCPVCEAKMDGERKDGE